MQQKIQKMQKMVKKFARINLFLYLCAIFVRVICARARNNNE